MDKLVKTVEEFIDWTKEVEGRSFVYRGFADTSWKVESSAYRRIGQLHETLPPDALQNYLKQLLESAQLRGFQEREGKSYTDLELLADLQHQGAATCLIDFTTNALIALWFACQDQPDQAAGKVVALATGDPDRFAIVTSEDLKQSIDTFLDKGKLWRWEPSHLNTRIVAQQSVFVFGTGTIDATRYASIQIDGGSKGTMREELAKRFGITEQHLFSDFPGFALSHGHDKPYRDPTADEYFSRGLIAQQQGDYEKAREFYDQAQKRDPCHPEAGKNLETVNKLLAEVKAREAEKQFWTLVDLTAPGQELPKEYAALIERLKSTKEHATLIELLKIHSEDLGAIVEKIESNEDFDREAMGERMQIHTESVGALIERLESNEDFTALMEMERSNKDLDRGSPTKELPSPSSKEPT